MGVLRVLLGPPIIPHRKAMSKSLAPACRARSRGVASPPTTMSAHDLGMNRRIPRRDFLNGVAVAVAGTVAGRVFRGVELSGQARDYPPALTGLRGNYPDAVAP